MAGPDHRALEIKASAAAWLARLRSDKRMVEDEIAFRRWLVANPAHAAAFELVNAVWDAAGPVRRDLRGVFRTEQRISRRAVFGGVAAAAGVGGAVLLAETAQANVFKTDIGEQKHLLLQDKTQLFLDTNSKVVVNFGSENRKASLEYGCANFRIAPNTSQPFAVSVADYVVVGDQTNIDVSLDGKNTAVIVLQGKASVESPGAPSRLLSIGQRMTAFEDLVKIDKPDLFPLLAWHTGQAVFRNDTLIQAAREMNRYSKQRLEIADVRVESLRVTGVYRVGDNTIFAIALAAFLPVLVRPFDDRIEIVGDDKRLEKI